VFFIKNRSYIYYFIIFILIALSGNFFLKSFVGKHGYLLYRDKLKKKDDLIHDLGCLVDHKNKLMQKTKGMHEETLKYDLLDENVRYVLGLISENEKIFIEKK